MNFTPPNLPPHDDELTRPLRELAEAGNPRPIPPLPGPPPLPKKSEDFFEKTKLARDESIVKGYCPVCGDVPVKVRKGGYKLTFLGVFFHISLSILTIGAWFFIWILWVAAHEIWKHGLRRTCMKCDLVLEG